MFTLLMLASEGAEQHESAGPYPYIIGAIALSILLLLMLALLIFGKGREHV